MNRPMGSILRAIAAVRFATLEIKFDLLLRALERRYRPDQPRAPKGTPEGGQWVADANSARREQSGGERVRVALAGVLKTQRVGLGDAGLVRHCIYEDIFGWQYGIEINAAKLCPPTYPTSPTRGAC